MSQTRAALGVTLVLVGTVFLLDALAVLDLWAAGGGWWPLLLVALGAVLLVARHPAGKPSRNGSLLAVLSARSAGVAERPFRGGRAVAVLGHAGLDFRSTSLHEGSAELRVFAILGDVAVTVPPGWRVRTEPVLLLADLDGDLLPAPEDAPVLSVTGVALLSDVRVRTGSIVG